MSDETLSNLLSEDRRFPPPGVLAAATNVTAAACTEASADGPAFWAAQAERPDRAAPWTEGTGLEPAAFARWFVGGRLNAAYNRVDRPVPAGHGDRAAFHWEGEPGDTRTLTYADLKSEVSRAANALPALGVQAGDRIAVYLPVIPGTVVAMLACARIGAPHTVVFGGFSYAQALRHLHSVGAPLRAAASS